LQVVDQVGDERDEDEEDQDDQEDDDIALHFEGLAEEEDMGEACGFVGTRGARWVCGVCGGEVWGLSVVLLMNFGRRRTRCAPFNCRQFTAVL
jgi:hypothetical protein